MSGKNKQSSGPVPDHPAEPPGGPEAREEAWLKERHSTLKPKKEKESQDREEEKEK